MNSIFWKEVHSFFSSLIGYVVIGVFLLMLGLVLWIFPDTSILSYNFASLDQLFEIAPIIFLFLIPAITMRTFSEENQNGTIELLITKPLTEMSIVLGKYFACLFLVVMALLPTVIYYWSVYQLGSPKGNLDEGAIMGSYIGLLLLSAVFVSIGIFASSISTNQIVSFLLSLFISFCVYTGFDYVSRIPFFVGKLDDLISQFGIQYHYESISRGIIDSRNVIYFFTVIIFFIALTKLMLEKRKW